LITVVTPSFNQGNFIRETIESVLSQGIDNLEYIIMDGGSTDQTLSIIEEYKDKLYFESKPDKGQADAVNQGIMKAKGDIIGWLNSDDIYYPGALSTVQKTFDENPEINIIYGEANHITRTGEFMERYYTEPFDYERLKDICFICQPALFFRKKIVVLYGYLDIELNYCMDYEYWLRLGKNETFLHIDKLLSGSRLYEENKTLGSKRKAHEEIVRMTKAKLGLPSERWVYNLAHVICDEKGIPREVNGIPNKRYAIKLAWVSLWLFIKHSGGLPKDKTIIMHGLKKYS